MKLLVFATAFSRRRFFVSAFITWSLFWASFSLAGMVTDDVGRKVEVPSNPKRIVSLAPSVTEILFALGLGDKIVGVTQFSDYPSGTALKEKIGTYIRPNIEKIVSLNPDLIIATADGNPREAVEQLEKLGLSIFTIFPEEINDIYHNMKDIGLITGKKEEGVALAESLEKRINEIADAVKGLKKPKVFFQIGTRPLYTAGKGTFIDRLITLAGGVNIVDAGTIRYPAYSIERIIADGPDVMLWGIMNKSEKDARNFWERWQTIPAVGNDRIYLVDPDTTNRPSPRLADGLELIARLLHPEAFQEGNEKP